MHKAIHIVFNETNKEKNDMHNSVIYIYKFKLILKIQCIFWKNTYESKDRHKTKITVMVTAAMKLKDA